MPRDGAATRRKILGATYELFYQKGYYRVSVDDVAAAAGITKRTLYYHYKSKDQLLSAVLEFYEALALERIRKWGDRLSGSPQLAVEALFADLDRWSSKPKWNGSGFTRLAMELADMPGHPARAVAGRHKKALEAWLAGLLARLGASRPGELARQVQLLMEGATSLTLIHGDRAYVAAAAKAGRKLAAGSTRR